VVSVNILKSLIAFATICADMAAAQAPVSLDAATISGRVVSSAGKPLGKVRISLTPDFEMSISVGYHENYRATTDGEGNFLFQSVKPGSYSFSAERVGYAPSHVGTHLNGMAVTGIVVPQRGRISDIVFKLNPNGIIAGSVLSDAGLPLLHAVLTLWREGFVAGHRSLVPLRLDSTDANVGDDGSFVIGGLRPGQYYLAASEQPPTELALLNVLRHEGTTLTYYPGFVDSKSAAVIEIKPGQEVRGINFRVQRTHWYSVSGKQANPSLATRIIERSLSLCAIDPIGGLPACQTPTTLVRSTGSFAFRGVRPGNYTLYGSIKAQIGALKKTFITSQPVRVAGSDQVGLALTSTPAVEIRGVVHGPANLEVFAVPTEWPRSRFNDMTQTNPDGSFQLEVAVGEYKFFIGNGFQHSKVAKSVLFRGREVLDAPVRVTAEGGTVEVFVGDAAEINGMVRNPDGQPASGATVGVWRGEVFIGWGTTDVTGHYRLRSLRPGTFRIAAWEDLDDGVVVSPVFRAAFESQAGNVSVSEGSTTEINLSAISIERSLPVVASLK
jgi:hypothetical protein